MQFDHIGNICDMTPNQLQEEFDQYPSANLWEVYVQAIVALSDNKNFGLAYAYCTELKNKGMDGVMRVALRGGEQDSVPMTNGTATMKIEIYFPNMRSDNTVVQALAEFILKISSKESELGKVVLSKSDYNKLAGGFPISTLLEITLNNRVLHQMRKVLARGAVISASIPGTTMFSPPNNQNRQPQTDPTKAPAPSPREDFRVRESTRIERA